MYFVGLDLAWGERNPTGLAVVDDDGLLVHVSAHRHDDSILTAVAPYVAGTCLVAIDAPLVVVNPSGNRPAEAALNRDFARFDAGAHPSNTGKPEFSSAPRGARLAEVLGLDIDPGSRSKRRAIEVYPHPATIALFELGRTLKYKQKRDRQLPDLRSELLRLTGLIETLGAATPALHVAGQLDWRALIAQVEQASRKSELRRVEDQVDAVLCAYVAMFAVRRPHDVTTYGDVRTGYIVTPTLPEGHRPTPRVRAPSPATVVAERPPSPAPAPAPTPARTAVASYAQHQQELRAATDRFTALVTTLLDDAGINYLSVTGRTKTVSSFAAKAARMVGEELVYTDPLEQITDQIGLRVITYLHSDVAAVADLLGEELRVIDDRDMGQETASEGRFGYASRHLLVTHDEPSEPGTDGPRSDRAQVQVRTVLQHAWAEFEHAIRYKGSIPEEHAPDLDRRFTLAAGLLELADREFTMIRDRLQTAVSDDLREVDVMDPRIGAQELATFLGAQYADAGWSRPDHYTWVSGLLLELGVTSLEELAGLLGSVDGAAINDRMGYRYPAGAVRRLDDALLAFFGRQYIDLHGNAHRVPLLTTRWDKLA